MSKAEKLIDDCTRNCSNQYDLPECFENGVTRLKEFQPWLTPDQARRAVEIAREEMIEKTCEWLRELNNHHHIMRYSDSCEPPLSELTEWFKNYIKGE